MNYDDIGNCHLYCCCWFAMPVAMFVMITLSAEGGAEDAANDIESGKGDWVFNNLYSIFVTSPDTKIKGLLSKGNNRSGSCFFDAFFFFMKKNFFAHALILKNT